MPPKNPPSIPLQVLPEIPATNCLKNFSKIPLEITLCIPVIFIEIPSETRTRISSGLLAEISQAFTEAFIVGIS